MTLDDLAVRYQLNEGSLLEAQQSGVNVHQTAITPIMPAPARPPLDAPAATQWPRTAPARHPHLTQPRLPVSASMDTAAVPTLNTTAAASTYQATLRRFTLDVEKEAQLSEHVHPAARGAAEAVVRTILHDEGPMALRPSSFHQLMQAANLIQNLNARAMADSTSAQPSTACTGQRAKLEVVDSLVCHLEYATCQSIRPLQGIKGRATARRVSLDNEHYESSPQGL